MPGGPMMGAIGGGPLGAGAGAFAGSAIGGLAGMALGGPFGAMAGVAIGGGIGAIGAGLGCAALGYGLGGGGPDAATVGTIGGGVAGGLLGGALFGPAGMLLGAGGVDAGAPGVIGGVQTAGGGVMNALMTGVGVPGITQGIAQALPAGCRQPAASVPASPPRPAVSSSLDASAAQRLAQSAGIDAKAFLGRFLLHVLPRRFVRIRHYGFLPNPVRPQKLARVRQWFAPPAGAVESTAPREPERWEARLLWLTGKDVTRWPRCGIGHLLVVEERPALAPPCAPSRLRLAQ